MRINFVLLFVVTCSLAAAANGEQPRRGAAATAPKYAMEITGAKHVVGVWRTRVYTTDFPATEWMISFPVATNLPRQSGAKTTMTPEGKELKDLTLASRPYLFLHVGPVDGVTPQSLSLEVRYEATLYARRLVSVSAGAATKPAAPLDPREKQINLLGPATLDFRADAFQAWLDKHQLRRQESEDEVDFARRVYTTMLDTYRYKDGVPIRPASTICGLAELDCDTLSVLFVSAMRANQIPARILFLWPAKTLKPDAKGVISGHAQAEFFAEGVGWVPVDIANVMDARALGKKPLRPFGEDDGFYLVAQVNPDYMIDTPVGRVRVNSMHPGPDVTTRAPKKADVHFQPQIWEVTVSDAPAPR
jgi:transglutaminase-like putative cysteine protease